MVRPDTPVYVARFQLATMTLSPDGVFYWQHYLADSFTGVERLLRDYRDRLEPGWHTRAVRVSHDVLEIPIQLPV